MTTEPRRLRVSYTDARGAHVTRLLPAASVAAYLERAHMVVDVLDDHGALVGQSWRLTAQDRADCEYGGNTNRRWGYWFDPDAQQGA